MCERASQAWVKRKLLSHISLSWFDRVINLGIPEYEITGDASFRMMYFLITLEHKIHLTKQSRNKIDLMMVSGIKSDV